MAEQHNIPENELLEYRECFRWFDKDGDGIIKGQDLPVAVRAMGQYWTFSELRALMNEFPPTSEITYSKFLNICSRKYGQAPDITELERAFEVFNRDRTGKVLLDDVRHVLTSVGQKLTVSAALAIFLAATRIRRAL